MSSASCFRDGNPLTAAVRNLDLGIPAPALCQLRSASRFQDGNPPKAAVRSLDLGIRHLPCAN